METLENMSLPCPHDICDGSGYIERGEFDESDFSKCLCRTERERDEWDVEANS